MLVLTRKINETVVIGENIRVTISAIRGRTVRLGIEARQEVAIVREELGRRRAQAPSQRNLRFKKQADRTEMSHP